ncbi:DUF3472 domain-containing protein [Pedobacter punctiformis]|uniref:DUF3472 domain-containing protein n=1 Tax=Pedobacter punctiformis TaxID=3004097 RepID=A0ABT4L8M8_9SPHI|nr:DUF3472 domain-containing protein [Pedobacter sp. HCMS5-2]MCZ4244291.1 DUF3472 domain-containing protein [Pedobacter sp. HCMS5-2]
MKKKNHYLSLMVAIAAFGISLSSCKKASIPVTGEKVNLSIKNKVAVSTVPADAMTFVIPANKAYAEPFEPNDNAVGVSVPMGYPEDYSVVSNWTNQTRSVVYYLYQTAGEYNFSIENTVTNGVNLNYEVKISPCYAGLAITPSSKTITFNGTGTVNLTTAFKVVASTTGYYRYELKPVSTPNNSITIHNLIFKALQANSKVNQTDYQSSPSVHLGFSSTASTVKSYDWLYQEVRVPTGKDPLYTFYMAIGFFRGYLGIQTNSPTERRVLFSVWDSADAQNDPNHTAADNVSLVAKESNVTSNGFGGEGTGGQSYINANWQTNTTVSLIMNVRQETTNSVLLSAWYKLEGQSTWNYIATWRAPKDQRYFDGFYSFLENFGYRNGQLRREAEYFNSWAKENVSGNWVHLNKTSFSNTDGAVGQRVDFEQGVSPSNSGRFYMSSGGYTPTIKTSNTVPLLTTPPSVPLTTLSARVDQALADYAGSSITNGGIYKIVSAVNNSSVIDVNSYTPVNETPVTLWSNNNPTSNNQKFLARKTGSYYIFKSMADTTKVLDVYTGSSVDGTKVQVYTFNNGNAQKWAVESAGGGYVYLKSAVGANKSLDVNGGSTANGTKIQIFTSGTSNAQKFKLVAQ